MHPPQNKRVTELETHTFFFLLVFQEPMILISCSGNAFCAWTSTPACFVNTGLILVAQKQPSCVLILVGGWSWGWGGVSAVYSTRFSRSLTFSDSFQHCPQSF